MKKRFGRFCLAVSILVFSGYGFAQDYSYSDGSANAYKIAPGSLQYIPVKKENSSSGTYSGGTAKAVKLNDADYRLISGLFEEGIAAKASHIDQRVKMSGVIRRDGKAGQTAVILKPGVGIKNQIDAKLLELLKRGE